MTLLIVILILAFIVQGGIFYYSYKKKQKSKKDSILIKYKINTRSDLFSALCRQDIPQIDMEKLNFIYTQKKEV